MPDFRVYAPAAVAGASELTLDAAESHHLVVVNRCRRGDTVVAFNGRGHEWVTECRDPAKSAAVLHVRQEKPAGRRPAVITLAQALPKGGTMDDIVRQATEVGAARIVPLLTERSQVHLDEDRAAKKVEKWHTTAVEAAKQCGNPWLPEILPIQVFTTFVSAGHGATDLRLIASLHAGARSLGAVLAHHASHHPMPPPSSTWLIGPEGDFSPGELTAAISAGFAPVTLGPLVLRSDTAALYALSILSNALQGG